jgi:protein-S-isoprenylcysteine O-methyltransferase Ste14
LSWLRLYLLAGLILHKAVWEVLKRQRRLPPAAAQAPQAMRVKLTRALKMAILLGIVLQTVSTDVLPITSEPFVLRTLGVLLYTLGLLMAITGRLQLGRNWSDIETAQVLRGQTVVAHGLFHYIRHPIYVGDLLLLLGLELSLNSWLVIAVICMIPGVLRQAVREEGMLVDVLPGYAAYCARTKRFIPFVV